MNRENKIDNSSKRQIRRLLFVISSGILIAFLFSGLLLYNYGPSGQVQLKNVLLSPQMLNGLNFNDKNAKTGGMSRFVFDKIQFEYDDLEKGEKKNVSVSNDQYQLFYNQISSAKSLADVTEEIKNSFNRGHPARLKILVKTESSAAWQVAEKIFQEMEFSSRGDYFRVQLRESGPNSNYNYAYFYQPNIYKNVLQQFSSLNQELSWAK